MLLLYPIHVFIIYSKFAKKPYCSDLTLKYDEFAIRLNNESIMEIVIQKKEQQEI